MLTCNLMGGLGNQLFQIAATYAYAKRHNLELVFKTDWEHRGDREPIWSRYLLNHSFQLLPPQAFDSIHWNEILEREFAYSPLPSPPDYPFVKLQGYFQSSAYFREYSSEIRSQLQIPPKLLGKAAALLECEGVIEPRGWIGAHVRRGDYVDPHFAPFHQVTTKLYFDTAREEIEKRLGGKRVVCWITEDPNWVYKTVYREGDKVFINDCVTDFSLLASFEHLILSNSSFSWWASWLNPYNYEGRHICAPSRWFGSAGPSNYSTVYEDDWILINPTSGNLVTQV
jgi:hypothetical protein